MARRAADRACAAFQRGDAVLKRRDGWVGQARIDIADFLQVEERRRVLGIAKHVSRGLVDRHVACAGGRIGLGACVNGQRVKALR
jgi:predicted NodU family carbamoyl transferase